MAKIVTEDYVDNLGLPGKRIVLTHERHRIVIDLSFENSHAMSDALKPDAKNITITNGQVTKNTLG